LVIWKYLYTGLVEDEEDDVGEDKSKLDISPHGGAGSNHRVHNAMLHKQVVTKEYACLLGPKISSARPFKFPISYVQRKRKLS